MARKTSSVSARKPDNRLQRYRRLIPDFYTITFAYCGSETAVVVFAFGFSGAEDFFFVFAAPDAACIDVVSLAFLGSLCFGSVVIEFSATGFKVGCATVSAREDAPAGTDPGLETSVVEVAIGAAGLGGAPI